MAFIFLSPYLSHPAENGRYPAWDPSPKPAWDSSLASPIPESSSLLLHTNACHTNYIANPCHAGMANGNGKCNVSTSSRSDPKKPEHTDRLCGPVHGKSCNRTAEMGALELPPSGIPGGRKQQRNMNPRKPRNHWHHCWLWNGAEKPHVSKHHGWPANRPTLAAILHSLLLSA